MESSLLASEASPVNMANSLNPFLKIFGPYIADSNREVNHGSDRGLVLVWCAIIDDLLLRILDEFTSDIPDKRETLFGSHGPFHSLGNKASTCLALGLISKDEFDDIRFAKRIRNTLAHEVGASLDTHQKQCHDFLARHRKHTMPTARTAFSTACFSVSLKLYMRLGEAELGKRSLPGQITFDEPVPI